VLGRLCGTIICMSQNKLSLVTGISYLVVFCCAIFANFFVLEGIINNPLAFVSENGLFVRFGVIAFLVAAVADVVIAWSLYEMFKENILSRLSTYFRLVHAAAMGIGVFSLTLVFGFSTDTDILHQIDIFNTIWLIGLFFFGFHLLLLVKIMNLPRWMSVFLVLAGVMYIVDTSAHFLLVNYGLYASVFLALVAIPSIIGEMSLMVWFLMRGIKKEG